MAFVVAMAGMMFPAYSMTVDESAGQLGEMGRNAPLTWKRVCDSMSKLAARRLAAATTKSSVSSSSLSKLSGEAGSIRFESRSTLRIESVSSSLAIAR